MNDTRDSRLRLRLILITIILATIPCYCSGLALVRLGSQPPAERPTSTPLWAIPATQTAGAASAVVPTSTPFFVTATHTATLPPSLTPSGTTPPTLTPTDTALPAITSTATPLPTDTHTPTPSETLPPTVTFTPIETAAPPYPRPSETLAPPALGQ